ncbi:MAG TPA: Gfo/Idh/MocA family oxidoreductase, partial [Candidatus Latescibacteria bacterium]|nr:Gfo/Idh/MocA family oxidoreductase [Candidatus Latescibacterota bacterium]
MNGVPIPDEPVRVALIGAGSRARSIYRPIMPSMNDWMRVVAVCDPVREHADALAASYGVPAFYDIRELVRSRPM